MTTLRSMSRTLPLILPLLLSACAVSRQGDSYKFGIDPDELSATTLQEFQLGTTRGVLRRTAQRQVQIKLYDRMKLIDLGRIDTVRVGDALRFPGHDLIVLHVPTASCPYAYRLYQLNGYEVGMWDINNRAGNCGVPLSFSADAQAWMAQQQSNRTDRQVWAWSGGQLISGAAPSMMPPAATPAGVERGGSMAGSFEPAPSAPAPAPKPAAGMRFESASGAAASAATPAPAASAPARPRSTAAAPAAPSAPPANSSKRIDAGSYARLPVATGNGGTVVPPTRIILRNSNGEADAAPQR